MFIKPFKTKSNTQVKSTDRRKIRQSITSAFSVTEDELNQLFPSKCTVNSIKIIANSGQQVTVYTCDKRPLFFEISFDADNLTKATLLPTVYALWILPEIVPTFTTHAAVLPRLAGGADLMLPGVIRQGEGRYAYGNYKCDQVIAVNLTSNRSAVGVGRLARSSEDLLTARNSGICVKMLHVFGDKLWNIEPSQVFQMPNAGATIKAPTMEEFPSLGESMIKSKKDAPKNNQSPFKIENDNIDNDDDDRNQFDDESDIISEIDKLDLTEGKPIDEKMIAIEIQDKKLKEAFLKALKKFGKQPPTQLLTSNFYRCHMLEADNSIDIKHSSYKKLSKFLSEMATDNFLTVKEETKGVEKITAFNVSHPDVVNYILKIDDIEASTLTTASGTGGNNLFVTEMKELYFVTESTMKFFNLYDIKCGEGIEPAQVKKFVKDYVCNNKLQDSINIRIIHVDDMIEELCDLEVDTKKIAFDDLLSSVYDKMKHSYAMRNKNELKTSGKTSTIKMTLATRSGNKKVTLIDHLEMFGIKLPEFAQACKIGVAASTSIYRPECPGNSNKGQLLVQGNQIRFVHKLLTDKYKIPPKYITGLDLAKKDKKPKKK